MNWKGTILITALFITGLSAGFFYAWGVSVIPGLKRISHKTYLETMQSINRAILNPAFFSVFFGALFFMLWSSYLQFRAQTDLSFWLVLGATVSYFIGTIGVTGLGNVPLNEALDVIELAALTPEDLKRTRISYETNWNQLHWIRTGFALLSFLLLLLANR